MTNQLASNKNLPKKEKLLSKRGSLEPKKEKLLSQRGSLEPSTFSMEKRKMKVVKLFNNQKSNESRF